MFFPPVSNMVGGGCYQLASPNAPKAARRFRGARSPSVMARSFVHDSPKSSPAAKAAGVAPGLTRAAVLAGT
jgi:hypothetical protein